MAIKVQVSEEKVDEIPFPKLMQNRASTIVLLFTSVDSGTILSSKYGPHEVGKHYDSQLDIREFIDFTGVIILQNYYGESK